MKKRIITSMILTALLAVMTTFGVQASDTAQAVKDKPVSIKALGAKKDQKVVRIDIGKGVTIVKTLVGDGIYQLQAETKDGLRNLTREERERHLSIEMAMKEKQSDEAKKNNPQKGSLEELIKRNHLELVPFPASKETVLFTEQFFTQIMSNMFQREVDLKLLDVYESKMLTKQKPGDIERIIHLVDIRSASKIGDKNNVVLFSAAGFNIYHYVEASKSVGVDIYAFSYDKEKNQYQAINHLSNQVKELNIKGPNDFVEKIMSKGVKAPIEPDTQLYIIADLLFKSLQEEKK